MRTAVITNAPAAKAYADYIGACQSRPQNEATIEAFRATLAAIIGAEVEAGNPGTGREVSLGDNRHGQPVTRSGMKPGTPYAVISRQADTKRRRFELCRVWPCGACESAGPACFSL